MTSRPQIKLSPTEVHLWLQPLNSPPDETRRYFELLAPDERARAARFHFDIHRNRFVAARGRLREILADYAGTSAARIVFTYREKGKPDLAEKSDLKFNLAHSGDVAVYAIAHGIEIGVDVEEIRCEVAREQIPERFFCPNEVQSIRCLPEDRQAFGFFQCWTRKEAYVKALAEGLSIPLNSFDVSFEHVNGCTLRSFDIAPNYIGAVAVQGGDWAITRMDQAIILR